MLHLKGVVAGNKVCLVGSVAVFSFVDVLVNSHLVNVERFASKAHKSDADALSCAEFLRGSKLYCGRDYTSFLWEGDAHKLIYFVICVLFHNHHEKGIAIHGTLRLYRDLKSTLIGREVKSR